MKKQPDPLEPLILLKQDKIKQYLIDDHIKLEIFENITSTNDYLKSMTITEPIQICLAEQQAQGRGRLGRKWYSPFGENIYMSYLYTLQKDINELAGLSMVATLAVMKTLKFYGILDHLVVKWPNDVIYKNKKLAGALVDVKANVQRMSKVIIGIGLNVNTLQVSNPFSQGWTSMRKILGKYIDRNVLSANLINHLTKYLAQFNQHGFSYFIDEWMQVEFLLNKTITVENFNKKIKGVVVGINNQGQLMLQLPSGNIQSFSSGDTTIMKKKIIQ